MNELIKQDYFKLIRDLNKSNKTENESTDIYFIIDESKLFAALSNEQKILLCIKSSSRWLQSKDGYYPELETHVAKFLNKNKNVTNLTDDLKLSIFQVTE